MLLFYSNPQLLIISHKNSQSGEQKKDNYEKTLELLVSTLISLKRRFSDDELTHIFIASCVAKTFTTLQSDTKYTYDMIGAGIGQCLGEIFDIKHEVGAMKYQINRIEENVDEINRKLNRC
jgi:hypothetical protein